MWFFLWPARLRSIASSSSAVQQWHHVAAEILGASRWRTVFEVVLPLIRSGLVVEDYEPLCARLGEVGGKSRRKMITSLGERLRWPISNHCPSINCSG